MSTTTISTRKTIIFREAAHLFREKGYSGSTLRELAKRAGVKGGSIYHHFNSKQEILFMIMEYTMTNLITKVSSEIEGVESPLAKLRKAIRVHVEYHTVDSDETYVADAELRSLEVPNYKKIVKMRDRYERLYKDMLQEGIDKGELAMDNVTISSRALLQMCTGISYWYNPEGPLSIKEIADSYVDLFFHGVCGNVAN
ncbi:TetR/AcrR family transcriptional regulator [Desulfoluna butyratoxydans]|uniref:Transcription regulator ysia c-terminal n=1 Tax=Desulfoluna butyratoxydans TaxID=231438 RepID=A0A4U8YYH5_9BACT|nr:TetR/AcrR family transcriptional regulator [Desulfoluna butyratoxydans]VFQ47212.1 transcription regulator ysia c-terminal [Desulfoluna butyratoxydans]